MKKEDKKFVNLFLRYAILALVAIPGMDLFYYVFLPLTKFPVYWALSPFYNLTLLRDTIFIGTKTIEIVGACVAGAAYYFLLILILSTPNIKLLKRLKVIGFTFATFLLINIIRIILLSFMFLIGSDLFDITHKIFWYMGSTIFVVLIWFLAVKIFKIKDVPIYSDLKFIYDSSSLRKKH